MYQCIKCGLFTGEKKEIDALKEISRLQAEVKRLKETIKNLKSGHFCPQPQLAKAKMATSCNCAHSDRHRAIDWATIEKLQAKVKWLKENLIEYGRHCAGCSQEFAKKYRCRCGWDKIEQALKESNGK